MGGQFALPMPMLWQHHSDKPIGRVVEAKKTKTGIPVAISIPKVLEEGTLKTRIDEAIQSIKYRLVTGLSIGFRALADGVELLKDGGLLHSLGVARTQFGHNPGQWRSLHFHNQVD
jgi:phage head maturation protease